MQVKSLQQVEFERIANRPESHFFDLKAKEIDGAGVQKIAVAFANSDGGECIIGVKDVKEELDTLRRWDGFSNIEAMNGILQALFSVSPSLPLTYECYISSFGLGYLLCVKIEKSSEVCKAANGKVFQRQGAQSLPVADPERIQQLAFAKGASSFEDQLLKGMPAELIVESPELRSFTQDFSPSIDPLEYALNENLLDFKSWEPRVASALLFHASPSAVIPRKCAVKVTRYQTREDDPEREHLIEQRTVEGPLNQLIRDSVAAVTEIMSTVKIWTASGMGTLEYPKEAIWETVANAVIHRDYSISDDIQIMVFEDRIEIHSPGRLPGYVTIANILESRFSRNTKIVRTLARYKDAPNKDLGEGLNTTFQKMKEFGLRAPVIYEDGNYVKVSLPHTPLASPGEAILEFLIEHDTIANAQARQITGIKSENAVKQEFYKLRDAGLLEPVPGMKGSKSAWQKTKK